MAKKQKFKKQDAFFKDDSDRDNVTAIPQPDKNEIATVLKDLDFVYGYIYGHRMENIDPVLRTESAGKGIKLYDEIARDAHAGSVIQQRINAVIGKEWEITPAASPSRIGRTPAKSQEQKIADFVSSVLEGCNFDQARQELLQAVLYGFYAAEIIWSASDDGIRIKKIIGKHPRRFIFSPERELRLLTTDNMIEGEPLPDRKFIVLAYGDTDNPYGRGLGQSIWWPVWFKKHGVKFWMVFLEKFGMPTVKASYEGSLSADQKTALLDAIDAIQTETGIVVPSSTNVEFMEATRAGAVSYMDCCDFMDRQISKRVLGQTLTTEIGQTGGANAAAQTHNDVRQEIIEADADLLDSCLNETLIRWIVDYNFPGVAAYPKIKTFAAPKPDLKQQSEIDRMLTVDIGLPMAKSYFYDTYGIPAPEEGEETVNVQRPDPFANVGKPIEQDGRAFADAGVKKNTEMNRAITGQNAVDALADRKISESTPIFENYITEITNYLSGVATLEEAGENLVSLFDRLDPHHLSASLRDALMEADRLGSQSAGNFAEAVWGLGTPFREQVDFFNARALTISGISKADLLAEVKDCIMESIKTGSTLEEFRTQAADMLKQNYSQINPRRIDTIYRTNMQASYQAARYRQMTDPAVMEARPFWRYVSVQDGHTRRAHAAMNGKIFRCDDPIWQTWYPPNGFNCRCTVVTVSREEMKRDGGILEPEAPVGLMPDQGWGDRSGSLETLLKTPSKGILWTEVKGQPGPAELGRPKEKEIDDRSWKASPGKVDPVGERVAKGMTEREAIMEIEREYKRIMGISPNESFGVLKGPDGEIVKVDLNSLSHAMAKREDMRERYLAYLRGVVEEPFEILLTEYETPAGQTKYRKKYIGLYREEKKHEGVVITGEIGHDGILVWNFMNTKERTIDRQRRGVKALYAMQQG